MKHRIEVTAEDILNGNRANIRSCPVARACQRVTGLSSFAVDVYGPDSRQVFFYPDGRGIGLPARKVALDLPDVKDWIDAFDQGMVRADLAPLTFDLEIPDDEVTA